MDTTSAKRRMTPTAIPAFAPVERPLLLVWPPVDKVDVEGDVLLGPDDEVVRVAVARYDEGSKDAGIGGFLPKRGRSESFQRTSIAKTRSR